MAGKVLLSVSCVAVFVTLLTFCNLSILQDNCYNFHEETFTIDDQLLWYHT